MFKDRSAVEEAYAFYAPLLQPLPRPSAAGLQTLLQDLWRNRSSSVPLSPTDLIDSSFLDELEQARFIATLYGR
jgi:hypothetical protein